MNQQLDNLVQIGTLASFGTGIIGLVLAVTSAFATFYYLTRPTKAFDKSGETDARLNDVRTALQQNQIRTLLMGSMSTVLVFGQFVVGGILTSSFIQSRIDSDTVGFLGLIVLISSLLLQQFRPDLKYRNARRRIYMLKAILTFGEDGLWEIKHDQKEAPSMAELRRAISEKMLAVDQSELEELAGETSSHSRAADNPQS